MINQYMEVASHRSFPGGIDVRPPELRGKRLTSPKFDSSGYTQKTAKETLDFGALARPEVSVI